MGLIMHTKWHVASYTPEIRYVSKYKQFGRFFSQIAK